MFRVIALGMLSLGVFGLLLIRLVFVTAALAAGGSKRDCGHESKKQGSGKLRHGVDSQRQTG